MTWSRSKKCGWNPANPRQRGTFLPSDVGAQGVKENKQHRGHPRKVASIDIVNGTQVIKRERGQPRKYQKATKYRRKTTTDARTDW